MRTGTVPKPRNAAAPDALSQNGAPRCSMIERRLGEQAMRNGLRWVGLAITGWLWAGTAGATNAVVTNCSSESDFATKLATVDGSGGGTITFNCGTATI